MGLADELTQDLNHDGAWPDPIPLATHTGEAPPFPVGCLPRWMQPHVLAVAAEQQVAVDLPAMLGITALSLANAKRYRVHVQGEWLEPVNLYTVTALPPSAGKSPVFKRFFKAIEQHEAELVTEAAERAEYVAQKRRMIEKRMAKAEQAGDLPGASVALDELRATPPVVIPRMIADDVTVEKMVELLREQGGRLALLSTEGGLFDAMAGRYTDKANLDPYLQAWSGDTIRADRMTREALIHDPLLTIGLTVQPAVIEALAGKPEFKGRGLTARFMYSIPPDFVGRRNFIDPHPGDPAAADNYNSRLLAMLREPLPETPEALRLSATAWVRFAEWRQGLEGRRTPDGDLRPMAEWTTKLESSVVRLAALLHVVDGAHGDISEEVMARALTVGEYWLAHAARAHDLWGMTEAMAGALVILRWLAERGLEEFSVRDVYRERNKRFLTAQDAVEPLGLLLERGWIKPLFDGPLVVGRPGVKSPRFAVHPQTVDNSTNCNNHVTHVTLVPKGINQDLSSSSGGSGGSEAIHDMGDMGDRLSEPDFEDPFA